MSSHDHSNSCITVDLLPLSDFFSVFFGPFAPTSSDICKFWVACLTLCIKIEKALNNFIFLLRDFFCFLQKAVKVKANHLHLINDEVNWGWFSDQSFSFAPTTSLLSFLGLSWKPEKFTVTLYLGSPWIHSLTFKLCEDVKFCLAF